MQSLLFLASLAAAAYAQINLTSCNATDLACIVNRTLADQALLETPNYVTVPIEDDPFYSTPSNFSAQDAQPGQILKIEAHSNISSYAIPPGQSLSRIMYTSVDEKGSVVPATAAILWPFTPKPFNNSSPNTYPLVAWAHGTSGVFRQCAVSNMRNLQYDFRSVFTLASVGYAVVIADYVGLGTDQPFSYLAYKLHANDVVYAVQASQSAFPQLSAEWVSFGHSEGGGVAWAIGERQAVAEIALPGFLGTIAAAPPPFPIANTAPVGHSVFVAFLSFTIAHLYGLNLTEIFNPVPLQALQRVRDISGCNDAGYAALATFSADDIYANTSWPLSQPARDFAKDYSVSGRPLGGPMLIIQGENDTVVGTAGAQAGFNATCSLAGLNGSGNETAALSVEYVSVRGQDHNPSLYASQRLWLQWIEDRFNGLPTARSGCWRTELGPGSNTNVDSDSQGGNAAAQVQLPERFVVQYSRPWVTIFSSTFLPLRLQAENSGFVDPPSGA
ncbi:hypothetical protein LTR84_003007 [Exophiala bonariae]|uniref:AB hydrolase-1 domain-containing protein n=1 Tax=Exophiala bonariae TaxID=1690606 RepID=A0AAV9N7S0_9EURO|nr:hypothetical protein LTR84_003007 [Exophiala bonariae]